MKKRKAKWFRYVLLVAALAMIFSRSVRSKPELLVDDFSNGLGAWSVGGGCGESTLEVEADQGPTGQGDYALQWSGTGMNYLSMIDLTNKFDHAHESPSFSIEWDEKWSAPQVNGNGDYDSNIETRLDGMVYANGHWLPLVLSLQRGKITYEGNVYTGWILSISVNGQALYSNYNAALDDTFGVSGFAPFGTYFHYAWRRALDGSMSLEATQWVNGAISTDPQYHWTLFSALPTSLIDESLDVGGHVEHDAIRFTALGFYAADVEEYQDNIRFMSLATEASPTLTLATEPFTDGDYTAHPAWTASENANLSIVNTGGATQENGDYGADLISAYQTDSSMQLAVADQTYFKDHWAPSWTLQWDQKWIKASGASFVSTPYSKVDLKLSDGTTSYSVSLKLKQRFLYDENNQINEGKISATMTTNSGTSSLGDVTFTDNIDDFGGVYHRMFLTQDSADETCDLVLNDLVLGNGAVESGPINALAAYSFCPPQNFGIPLSTITRIQVTGIAFGASLTDAPTEVFLDNIAALAGNDWQHAHPDNFDHYVPADFYGALDTSHAGPTLEKSLGYSTRVAMPPAWYYLQNTLTIDRDFPLFLASANRVYTSIISPTFAESSPDHAIVKITKAPLVNFSNLRFDPLSASNDNYLELRAISLENGDTATTRLELQNDMIDNSVIDIKGKSTAIVQGSLVGGGGRVYSPIIVDHPDAAFYGVGGFFVNYCLDPALVSGDTSCAAENYPVEGDSTFLVHQKEGRVVVFNVAMANVPGRADFGFRTRSQVGQVAGDASALPHLLVGSRSEGRDSIYRPSTFAYVFPDQSGQSGVDLMIKSNDLGWQPGGYGASTIANYNSTGKLWLIGNESWYGAGLLAGGTSETASVFAFGNQIYGDSVDGVVASPFGPNIIDSLTVQAGNLYQAYDLFNDNNHPFHKLYPASAFIGGSYGMPPVVMSANTVEVPEIPLPDEVKLHYPKMNYPLPGMIDVTNPPAGTGLQAVDADTTGDQREKIQAILNYATSPWKGSQVYFPAGTYHVSQPLGYNHIQPQPGDTVAPTIAGAIGRQGYGGWIAGAGKDSTLITRLDGDTEGPVWLSESMAYMNVSGIHFQTTAYDDDDSILYPAFQVNWLYGLSMSSQEIAFDDCNFEGGYVAFGLGSNQYGFNSNLLNFFNTWQAPPYWLFNSQCDTSLLVNCTFAHAGYGFMRGHDNALDNMPIDGVFSHNFHAFGGLRGGFNLWGAAIDNNDDYDFSIISMANYPFYFYGVKSSSPRILSTLYGWTGWYHLIVFDHSLLQPQNASSSDYVIDSVNKGGGPIFIDSVLDAASEDNVIRIQPLTGPLPPEGFGFKIHSDIKSGGDDIWPDITISNKAQAFTLE